MRPLPRYLNLSQRGLRRVAVCTALALAGTLGTAFVQAQEIKVGGTGAALATMQILADAYRKTVPGERISVLPSLGSSGGIKAVLAGAIQVAVSSRRLEPAEASQGASAFEYGRTPFVFAVPLKAEVEAITVKDLVEIYSGARGEWPDGTRIRLVLRPAGEADTDIVKSISPELRQALTLAEKRPGTPFAFTDQKAADAIESIPGGFGPTSLAQIITEKRALRPLRLNGVAPSAKAIADGTYPYYKSLYIVTGPRTPAAARDFAAFARSPAGREILTRNGYALP